MSSPTAAGGERLASRVGRAEQVPPSASPSDAALPPTAQTQQTTGRSSVRDDFGTGSVHLLRWVNHPPRRIQMFWRMQRASSMCWAPTEAPRFLSKDALHHSPLACQNTGNTQIRHLRSGLFHDRGLFYAPCRFLFYPYGAVLPSLFWLRIPSGPGKKEFLPLSLSDTVKGSAHGNNPEKRARKTRRKKSDMISESGLERAAVLLLVPAPLLPLRRHHRGNRAPLFGEPVRRMEQRSHRSATHARRRRRRRVQPTANRHSGDCGRDESRREGEKAG